MMHAPIDCFAAVPVLGFDMGAFLPFVVSHVMLVLIVVLIVGVNVGMIVGVIVGVILREGRSAAEDERKGGNSQDSGQRFHNYLRVNISELDARKY